MRWLFDKDVDERKESVWDYPREPMITPNRSELVVFFAGRELARTSVGWRQLKHGYPPLYFFPPRDTDFNSLLKSDEEAEWISGQGSRTYFDLEVGNHLISKVAWCFTSTTDECLPLHNHFTFIPDQMDICCVDGDKVIPRGGGKQGWVTSLIRGPFADG